MMSAVFNCTISEFKIFRLSGLLTAFIFIILSIIGCTKSSQEIDINPFESVNPTTTLHTELDTLSYLSRWLAEQFYYGDDDVTQELEQEISNIDWRGLLDQVEQNREKLYRCTVLSSVYQKFLLDFGFRSHIVHIGSGIHDCGHTFNVVQSNSNRNRYYYLDVWGQNRFVLNPSFEPMDYFTILNNLDNRDLTIAYDSFLLEFDMDTNFLGFAIDSEDLYLVKNGQWETFTQEHGDEITSLCQNQKVFFNAIDSIANKEGFATFFLTADYSLVSQEWGKNCRKYLNLLNQNNYSFHRNVTFVNMIFPDTVFYEEIMSILDTNNIPNNYFPQLE